MKLTKLILFQIFAIACSVLNSNAQVIDTIANWDGINVVWTAANVSTQEVENPDQSGINPSENCLRATTSSSQYDLIFTDFATPVNFNEFPKYRIKILAPLSGGTILFKFENSTNTSWVEIEKTPTPGQWDELEFDFSETFASDYVRMVVFFDFLGSSPGNQWYLDDVLRIGDGSAGLTSNLPIVIINTNGVPIPDEPKIDGEMKIIDNGYGNQNNQYDPPNGYDGFIGIEIRGQSTQMFPKKSYGFETRDAEGENLNVSLMGMPEENDWVLYGPYSDKSMLRNFISYYIGSKLDPYCTRMAYCEVIENNDYKGIYMLLEKIKKDENRVNIATLKPEDISGDELTGGYILRVDKTDPGFQYGYDGWKSYPSPPYPNAMHITYQYYYPKPEDIMDEQADYIRDYILDAENSLTGSYYSDPNIGYNKYLNVGSFVDLMILREMAKEVDSYRYSTYFYKEKYSDGGKLFAGPAWDFNLGFANVDYYEPGVEISGWIHTEVEPWDAGRMFWWKRMMEDPYFNNLFFTRWHQLRENEIADDQLFAAIDSVTQYIDQAHQRNYNRWPILGVYVWPNYDWMNNTYEDEVAFFKDWLTDRTTWLDDNIPGNMLNPVANLSGQFPELELTLEEDYFSRETLKNKYFDLNNAPDEIYIDTLIHQNASEATIILGGTFSGEEFISITIDKKVINTFQDITSNQLSITLGTNQLTRNNISIWNFGETLILSCPNPKTLGNRLQIFNLSGQLISEFNTTEQPKQTFDLHFKPGLYILSGFYNGKPFAKRILIQK